jgi:hypothetical protein
LKQIKPVSEVISFHRALCCLTSQKCVKFVQFYLQSLHALSYTIPGAVQSLQEFQICVSKRMGADHSLGRVQTVPLFVHQHKQQCIRRRALHGARFAHLLQHALSCSEARAGTLQCAAVAVFNRPRRPLGTVQV